MNRSLRRRLEEAENFLSLTKAKRQEKQQREITMFTSRARLHATAVAAIVKFGQPKIDEPLFEAWRRVLQHLQIRVSPQYWSSPEFLSFWSRVNEQERAAQQILVEQERVAAQQMADDELEREGELEGKVLKGFSKILKTAPNWLLVFTNTYLDRGFLPQWDLPSLPWGEKCISRRQKWGTEGYEASVEWPALPLGKMTDGDPVSDEQAQLWPGRLISTKKTDTVTDCKDKVIDKKKDIVPVDFDELYAMKLAMDLEDHPEKEKDLSRHEKLRLRRLFK
jgi:hypothetical protein